MKEIDFLPQWYKQRYAQKKKRREYYAALGLILIIMGSWSVFAHGRVAAAKAKNIRLKNTQLVQSASESAYDKAMVGLARLKARNDILVSAETKVQISSVLAELSHLIDGRVVLNRIEIKSEPFDKIDMKKNMLLRIAATDTVRNNKKESNTRFRIVIAGVATNAAEVARLISKLEQSRYFVQIIPGFSRNTIVQGYEVSEFEISCFLANYKIVN